MKNLIKAALTSALLLSTLVLGNPTTAVTPTVTLETQAWWNKAGIVVPTAVGSHIHVKATMPVDGAILDGTLSVPITITLHEARGKLVWFRMGTESTQLFNQTIILGPCTDCTLSLTANLNIGQLPTGRHELRMSANNADEDPTLSGSQRMYQSSGFQFCVRSCTPSYRSGAYIEARGWYLDHAYANAKLMSPSTSVKPGATLNVRLSKGSGGLTTKYAAAFLDPDFHHGSSGTTLPVCVSSTCKAFWTSEVISGTIKIPTGLSTGAHKLVLLSHDGQNAGVLVMFFNVP